MPSLLDRIALIVTHTPPWVFALFVVLIVLGAMAMRPRVVRPQRMLVTPAIFMIWGLISLITRSKATPLLGGEWVVMGAVGLALGWATTRLPGLRADRAAGLVHLPGSPALMARVLVVFFVKYGLSAAAAMHPEMADRLAPWDVAVSGLMAGYFLGWLLRFRSRMRTAPDVAAPGVTAPDPAE